MHESDEMICDYEEMSQIGTSGVRDVGLDAGMPCEPKGSKRRYRRWMVGGRLTGWIDATHEASFIDLSLGGALVEHSNIIRPGRTAFLTFVFRGQETALRCRVVHSRVYSYAMGPVDQRDLVYRTGLEFLDTSETSLHLIDKTIHALRVAA